MIYPENFEIKSGFDRIRDLVADNCLSPMGLDLVKSISFSTSHEIISFNITATYEFQELLRLEDYFPSDHYYQTSGSLNKIRIEGSFPELHEVFDLKRSLETVKSITGFFKKRDVNSYPVLKSLAEKIKIYPFVIESIDRVMDKNGAIKENASPKLKEIRNDIAVKSSLSAKKLNSIFKMALAEGIVDSDTVPTVRNGRGVIPVNASDKRKIKGLIHDQSASGKTVFIEPSEIVELNNEILELEYEERREIVRILITLADNIRPYIDELLLANDFLGEIDFIRAKAILGNSLGSIKPVLNEGPGIFWRKAIHPLLFLNFKKLSERTVVPLDIKLDGKVRIILISGPNAGGKSVCLKTVGLLQYMIQCGFTIPVGEGSESGIFSDIFIDIGDEQSIENDLSTYSSHLINMKYFLKNASLGTLLLIDEFGTGTEPVLGGSIAESILSRLVQLKVTGVITTHYTNLKHFASVTEGIVNGAMLFDNHKMQPLFQLSIGKPGSSFAFEIARKIGLPEDILKAASEKAGIKNINYDRHLKDIARDKRYWETKRQNIRQHEKRLEELIEEYERELSSARNLGKDIISRAKGEAESLLNASNRIIEKTIRQIRETQAEKEKTREIRQALEEFKSGLNEETPDTEKTQRSKISKLSHKAENFRKRRSKARPEITVPESAPLKQGDPVRITETMAVGEIIKVEEKFIHIETGTLRIKVPLGKVERISPEEFRNQRKSVQPLPGPDPGMESRRRNFKPEIDIRGVRGEEALELVRHFIDDALIVQYRHLRILHGKGNGILRNLIREYLATVGIVKSFRDENPEFGGSGITVVEMDF